MFIKFKSVFFLIIFENERCLDKILSLKIIINIVYIKNEL